MSTTSQSLAGALGDTHTPASLAWETIEARLRDAIVAGRLPAGTPLRQEELAAAFGVSRMPVREALRRLEMQGLATSTPHKGAVVAPLITSDAIETYEVRLLLEPEALRQSLPRLRQADLVEARALLAAVGEHADAGAMAELNTRFHLALYRRATNRHLLRLIESELRGESRFLRFHASPAGTGATARADHLALLEAAERGDAPGALAVLDRHLRSAMEAIRRWLDAADPETV